MAKYELINIEIKKVAEGKQNAGEEYLIADASNVNCRWEEEKRFTSFQKSIINLIRNAIPVEKGGTAATLGTIDDSIRYIFGRFETYYPATDFYKHHIYDDPQGRWKAGDVVRAKNGTPLIFPKESGIVVFVQYYMDEQGKEQVVRGMSLAEQGMRAFQAYCEPVSVAPAATTAPLQTPAITPQAQQAAAAAQTAQAAAGTIVQIGTNADGSPIYGPAQQ